MAFLVCCCQAPSELNQYNSALINQLTLSQRANAIGKYSMTTDHEVKSYNSVYNIVWEKLRLALSDN